MCSANVTIILNLVALKRSLKQQILLRQKHQINLPLTSLACKPLLYQTQQHLSVSPALKNDMLHPDHSQHHPGLY